VRVPTIRIDDEVFEGLKKLAEPLVDTPSSVIRRLLEEKQVIQKRLKESRSVSPGTAAAGLTPQPLFESYLLEVLDRHFAGSGDKRNVTQSVIETMRADGHITPGDLELVATGETKAENTISWARNALKERGLISRESKRGVWELTAQGLAAARTRR
jgi:predicted CopG family antitoxin